MGGSQVCSDWDADIRVKIAFFQCVSFLHVRIMLNVYIMCNLKSEYLKDDLLISNCNICEAKCQLNLCDENISYKILHLGSVD